jgi:predicted nucleic acid-binding protein
VILYLDTSAFLKLYLDETGSRPVREFVAGAAAIYTHLITYAEMRAALARAVRMGRMSEADARYQISRFEDDWLGLAVIDVDDALVRRAGRLAEQHGLRGYDSVHAAAAERIFENIPGGSDFGIAAFDNELRGAVESLGMKVLG